ncbi:restriction endonuclease subunit S [Limosilactobacillus reuteri subsp. suis]|uniref:restriction endonuclease subunit S n=1 Tax=Limosilactobacillus reuteri TaxID=1598 RepID=UPI0039954F28
MKVKLGDYVLMVQEREVLKKVDTSKYVSTENILADRNGVKFPANTIPLSKTITTYKKDDILISNIRPYFKKIWKAEFDGPKSNDVIAFRTKDSRLLQDYLYVVLQSDNFFNYVTNTAKGTKMPRGDKKAIINYEFELPNIQLQRKISHTILVLEKKIRLNNQINDNLDALLTNIFKKYMINDGFEKSNLTQIANYKNGLAMQKYRPNSNEESLPVLKIKELNQGNTDDSSDRCSANLDNSVIVNTGDIIFSWSGTLLVKNWTGDKAGLNQHLFKVTSNKYPAWFIYEWTKYHLLRFQAIAAGKATTMGHIKRSDLKSSLVYIPSQLFLAKMDSQLAPIYSQRLNLIKENQQLSKLKQTLLKKYF